MTPQIRPVVPSDFLILTVVVFILLWAFSPATLIIMVPALVCSLMVSHAHVPKALVAFVKRTCFFLTSCRVEPMPGVETYTQPKSLEYMPLYLMSVLS